MMRSAFTLQRLQRPAARAQERAEPAAAAHLPRRRRVRHHRGRALHAARPQGRHAHARQGGRHHPARGRPAQRVAAQQCARRGREPDEPQQRGHRVHRRKGEEVARRSGRRRCAARSADRRGGARRRDSPGELSGEPFQLTRVGRSRGRAAADRHSENRDGTRDASRASPAAWSPAAASAAWRQVPLRAQGRAVRIVVPFAPGGGADLIARLLQPHLQSLTGQSFYVENRAGAAGRIGTGVVAKSEPDGQTLLMTTESSIVIAPHMGVAMNYDPLKEFAAGLAAHAQHRDPGRASLGARQHAAGVHGARARQPRQDVLRVVRRRRAESSRRRDLQADDRTQHRARPLPGHRRRDPGGDLEPGRRHVGLHGRTDPAYPQRLAEGRSRSAASSARRRCRTCRRSRNPACPATRPPPGSGCSRPPRRRTPLVDKLRGRRPRGAAGSRRQGDAAARRLRDRRAARRRNSGR